MSPIFLYLQLRRTFPPRTAVFRVYYRLVACGLELCTLLHQPGLLLSIRWVWSGTVHSLALAWHSTQHQMGVAWNYALCCISLAFYSASDGCGLELCTLLHQPGILLSIRWVWSGTVHSLASAWTPTPHQMGVAWNCALCCISLAFYSASEGCGLELCTLLHQPGILLSIR